MENTKKCDYCGYSHSGSTCPHCQQRLNIDNQIFIPDTSSNNDYSSPSSDNSSSSVDYGGGDFGGGGAGGDY